MSFSLFNLLATAVILSKSEQLALVSDYQATGSVDSLGKLVDSNVRLACNVARKHKRNGIDLDDLMSAAVEGIVVAADKFDASKNASFTTCAKLWMRAKCQEFVQDNAGTIRVGTRTAKKLYSSLPRVRRQFGSEVSAAKIASELNLDEKDVAETLTVLGRRMASVDTPINSDGGTLGNVIASRALNQEERMSRTQDTNRIHLALVDFADNLSDRDRAIFEGRVIAPLTGSDVTPANDIAETYGVSKQRVSQLEKRVKTGLRDHLKITFGEEIQTMMGF
jgi:RNA polymerase sigma factor (sigma-70 family)